VNFIFVSVRLYSFTRSETFWKLVLIYYLMLGTILADKGAVCKQSFYSSLRPLSGLESFKGMAISTFQINVIDPSLPIEPIVGVG
jgi:hypothetical protein